MAPYQELGTTVAAYTAGAKAGQDEMLLCAFDRQPMRLWCLVITVFGILNSELQKWRAPGTTAYNVLHVSLSGEIWGEPVDY